LLNTAITTHLLDIAILQSLAYTYDKNANVSTITDNQAGPQTETFGYDSLNRLTSTAVTGGTNGFSESYQYDADSGNLSMKDSLTYSDITYSYNDPDHAHAVTEAGSNSYGYDANGNMIQRYVEAQTFDLAYDAENRLVAATNHSALPPSTPTPILPTATNTATPTSIPTETPTSTPTPTNPPMPAGAGIYDDGDPAWSYTGNWASYSGSGPYDDTLHYTSTMGDAAELTFSGTRFTLFFTKDYNRGSIEVYLDGDPDPLTTIDAYSASYAFQQSYTSPSLTNDTHTVRLVHAGGDPISTSMPFGSMERLGLLRPAPTMMRIRPGVTRATGRVTVAVDPITIRCITPAQQGMRRN
jgi:hypothetical protein